MATKDYTETCADPRPVPPMGWCGPCIRQGDWVRAATLVEGTALCATHVLHNYGPADDLDLDMQVQQTGRDKMSLVLDALRSDLTHQPRTTIF
jgi:hypothetical protein